MKVALLTYGSRGDVQPFAALACGLQKAGHRVQLAAPNRFANFAAQMGIPFTPLAGDPQELSARLNNAGGSVFAQVSSLADYVLSIAQPVARAAFTACKGADLIVHSFLFTTGAHSLARLHGIPDVSVQGFPVFIPTRAFPMAAFSRVPPGSLSYFTHWLSRQLYWNLGLWGFGRLRRLAPELFDFKLHWPFDSDRPDRGDTPGGPRMRPPTPLLFAYSPVVLPRPADWTASSIHITGYFFLDTPGTYHPPAELADFLAAGEPPVCITFGSMVNRDAGRIDRIVRLALAGAGRRGIVLTGWGGRGPAEDAQDLLYLEAAPHDWLLPRCRAVIHHGGAGTTAAGLRAGIPNIVIPHAVDQPFWGRRVAAIGAGPAPIDLKRLSVDTLTAAILQAEEPPLRYRADEIGRQIRQENGVARAVQIIESHAAGFNDSTRS